MPITFDEKTIGMWFVPLSDAPRYADWMGSARWSDETDVAEFVYRFRYSDNENPWDESDEKHWFKAKVAATSHDEAVDRIRTMIAAMLSLAPLAGYNPQLVDELLHEPNESLKDFIARFRERPYVHEQSHTVQ